MESWMISLGIAIVAGIAGYAGMKVTLAKVDKLTSTHGKDIESLKKFTNENKPVIDHLSRGENATSKTLMDHSNDLIELKTKLAQSPTMKEVRDEFVSKEIFIQMEKHIDERFQVLNNGISEILSHLKEK